MKLIFQSCLLCSEKKQHGNSLIKNEGHTNEPIITYLLFVITIYTEKQQKCILGMFINFPKAVFWYLTNYYPIVTVGSQKKTTSLQDILRKCFLKISFKSER